MKEFLPIGSVVLLKGSVKRIMVIGRVQICDKKAYKYSGVLYPEGFMGSERLYLFNEDDIEKIFYRGLEDEEEAAFTKVLTEQVEAKIQEARGKES